MPIDPDPNQWPMTAEFLRLHEKWREAREQRAPIPAWAFGAAMDRNDMSRVPKLVALATRAHGG